MENKYIYVCKRCDSRFDEEGRNIYKYDTLCECEAEIFMNRNMKIFIKYEKTKKFKLLFDKYDKNEVKSD